MLYIEPYVSLGSFFKFDMALIHRNQLLGYQDAMKKFHRYVGSIYTFLRKMKERTMRLRMHYLYF